MNSNLLFRWRSAVASFQGPESPITRLVLLTLALHMNEDGGSCFPSTERLSIETSLSERSVCTHLELAATAGWLRKHYRATGKGAGKGWRRHDYQASLPDIVLEKIQQHGTERAALGAERHDNLVLKDVQYNSSYSSSKNSPNVSDQIYRFYLDTISPLRRSGQRARRNITHHLKKHNPESLRQSVLNYAGAALKSDPQYRKDPANFFSKNDPYFVDYLPENFTQTPPQRSDPYCPIGVDFDAILAN